MNSTKPTVMEATQIVANLMQYTQSELAEVRDIRKRKNKDGKLFSVLFDGNVHMAIYSDSIEQLERYMKKNHYSTGFTKANTDIPQFPQQLRGIHAWASHTKSYHITNMVIVWANMKELPLPVPSCGCYYETVVKNFSPLMW